MFKNLKREIAEKKNPDRVKDLQRFYKTGPGEYGEGDEFLGLMNPQIRSLAKKFSEIKNDDMLGLISSRYNEERLLGFLILEKKYLKAKKEGAAKEFVDIYIDNISFVNNWNLVDLTSLYILGDYLLDKDRGLLYDWADSTSLWLRRISIITTLAFIRKNDFKETVKIARILLNDEHDLIHKAVGWMLREVGKRDLQVEVDFLNKHYKNMPRTMLRYAIERFEEEERQKYLKGLV